MQPEAGPVPSNPTPWVKCRPNKRASSPGYRWGFCNAVIPALILPAFLLLAFNASAQSSGSAPTKDLRLDQILDRMEQHENAQRASLRHYRAQRHYAVQYRGWAKTLEAAMDVELTYDLSSGKNFLIVKRSGSQLLCRKVLERALESEKEASMDKRATALTRANYKFQLLGAEDLHGRSAYILNVEPITPSKFLYKGKIWVDAQEFAVAKMEVEPARNPSFWISRTVIHHSNAANDGFWLPLQNRSETKVRIGGTAVMTIDYGPYDLTPNGLN